MANFRLIFLFEKNDESGSSKLTDSNKVLGFNYLKFFIALLLFWNLSIVTPSCQDIEFYFAFDP
jgi:hypothetical protein